MPGDATHCAALSAEPGQRQAPQFNLRVLSNRVGKGELAITSDGQYRSDGTVGTITDHPDGTMGPAGVERLPIDVEQFQPGQRRW